MAAALFPGEANAAKAANATLNLAILFQTLDADNNPDNGISLPQNLAITGFSTALLEQEPEDFVDDLNSNSTITSTEDQAVSPSDAAEHYYANELPGTWFVENDDSVLTLTIDDATGEDRALRYIIAEIGKENDFTGLGTGLEAGVVDVEDSGKVVLVDLDVTARTRKAGACPLAYGERYEKDTLVPGTGTELKLVGEKLEITIAESNSDCEETTLTLTRHKPIKNTMVGTWLEYSPLNAKGNAIFDRKVGTTTNQSSGFSSDELLQIYFADKVIGVVLDCENGKCGSDEQNGLFYAEYSFTNNGASSSITLNEILVDTVTPDLTESFIAVNVPYIVGASSDNDTRRSGNDGEEDIVADRLLSLADLLGNFKLDAPLKAEYAPVEAEVEELSLDN